MAEEPPVCTVHLPHKTSEDRRTSSGGSSPKISSRSPCTTPQPRDSRSTHSLLRLLASLLLPLAWSRVHLFFPGWHNTSCDFVCVLLVRVPRVQPASVELVLLSCSPTSLSFAFLSLLFSICCCLCPLYHFDTCSCTLERAYGCTQQIPSSSGSRQRLHRRRKRLQLQVNFAQAVGSLTCSGDVAILPTLPQHWTPTLPCAASLALLASLASSLL